MKIIVAGAFKFPMYQEALCSGFDSLGAQIIRCILPEDRSYNLMLDYRNGKKLTDFVIKENADVLFLYRVENIFPFFIRKIKQKLPNLVIMQYHNDDPFRKGFKRYIKSYLYLHYIKYTDLTYVYRPVNVEEAKSWGAHNVKLYMSHYYSKTDTRNLEPKDCTNKDGKIVFLGHWENDDRMAYICECFNCGLNIHIYGPDNWREIFEQYNLPLENLHPLVRGEEYIKTIHDSSIALAFFSKANRDEYTRRCFEIPMAGTVILQPSTTITRGIFKDGVDSVLYSSVDDMISKAEYYLAHEDKLAEIAYNGYSLMKNGPFSENARAEMVIQDYEQIKQQNI